MSNPLEGLQFPVQEGSNKPSTTRTGKEIIAEALSLVDSDSSQQASKEKNWRKTYPKYFKALVYQGIRQVNHPITIAARFT